MLNYAKYLDGKMHFPRPLYFNLFFGALSGIPGRLEDVAYLLGSLPDESVWSVAGLGRFQLPVNVMGLVAGGGVRVGLEDNVYYDYEKRELAANARLVERMVRIAGELGRDVATPEETRRLLRLPSVRGVTQ
jgi:uncharacterized protein (DUF849 family)